MSRARGPAIALLLGLVVAATIGSLIALQIEARTQNSGATGRASSTPTPACAPQPCADALGYVTYVREIDVSGPIVRVQVAFTVRGQDRMHAEPIDFRLIDADQERLRPIFDASGCPPWPRTDIPDGTGYGPVTVCFRPASTRPPLILSWEPDLGFFSTNFPIRIR